MIFNKMKYTHTLNKFFVLLLKNWNKILVLVVPSKRTFTKKSGAVTSNIDKRYNPLNQEEQDSSSSSDELKTMTEVCHQIDHL